MTYAWPDEGGDGLVSKIKDFKSLLRVNSAKIADYKVCVVVCSSESEFAQMGMREKLALFTDSANGRGSEHAILHNPQKSVAREIEELIDSLNITT